MVEKIFIKQLEYLCFPTTFNKVSWHSEKKSRSIVTWYQKKAWRSQPASALCKCDFYDMLDIYDELLLIIDNQM